MFKCHSCNRDLLSGVTVNGLITCEWCLPDHYKQNRDYDLKSSPNYCRMNPDLPALIDRLKAYASIDYGTEAYPLSKAEAALIVKHFMECE
jgi:hypothetical protein